MVLNIKKEAFVDINTVCVPICVCTCVYMSVCRHISKLKIMKKVLCLTRPYFSGFFFFLLFVFLFFSFPFSFFSCYIFFFSFFLLIYKDTYHNFKSDRFRLLNESISLGTFSCLLFGMEILIDQNDVNTVFVCCFIDSSQS